MHTHNPAPNQDAPTPARRAPRRLHIVHHIDVDGTIQALCGMRFTPRGKTTATLVCPVCEAVQTLQGVKL